MGTSETTTRVSSHEDSPSAPSAESVSPLRELLKPTDVARRLGVSRSWLYDAAKVGRIPSVRLGGPDGPLRFVEEDLVAWIESARSVWQLTGTSAATLRRVSRERPAA